MKLRKLMLCVVCVAFVVIAAAAAYFLGYGAFWILWAITHAIAG